MSQPELSTTSPSSPQVEPWREVAAGINSGAYAVLLALVVVYVLTRRAIGKAWVSNFDTLNTLRQTAQRNSDSIRQFAESQEQLVNYLIDTPNEPQNPKVLLKYLSNKGNSVDKPTETKE